MLHLFGIDVMAKWKVHVGECVFLAEASIYNEPRVSLATISNFPSPTQLPPPFFWACFKRESFHSERELGFRVVVNPKRRTEAAAAADHPRAVLLLIIP